MFRQLRGRIGGFWESMACRKRGGHGCRHDIVLIAFRLSQLSEYLEISVMGAKPPWKQCSIATGIIP